MGIYLNPGNDLPDSEKELGKFYKEKGIFVFGYKIHKIAHRAPFAFSSAVCSVVRIECSVTQKQKKQKLKKLHQQQKARQNNHG